MRKLENPATGLPVKTGYTLVKSFGPPGTEPTWKKVPEWQVGKTATAAELKIFEQPFEPPKPSKPLPPPPSVPMDETKAPTIRTDLQELKAIEQAIKAENAGIGKTLASIGIKPETLQPKEQEMFGIGKILAKKVIDNVTDKTLAKSKLSDTQKTAFKSGLDDAIERSNIDEVISSVDKVQTAVAGTALAVLTPGLAGVLKGKIKTSGPIANLDRNAPGTWALSSVPLPSSSSMPAWVVPVAIVAALLMFGKKLLR